MLLSLASRATSKLLLTSQVLADASSSSDDGDKSLRGRAAAEGDLRRFDTLPPLDVIGGGEGGGMPPDFEAAAKEAAALAVAAAAEEAAAAARAEAEAAAARAAAKDQAAAELEAKVLELRDKLGAHAAIPLTARTRAPHHHD